MSAHVLNIFIERINIARRVRFSLDESGTVKSFTYDSCSIERTWLCACVGPKRSEMDKAGEKIILVAQVEVQRNWERWG
jgi:hypothetical protein